MYRQIDVNIPACMEEDVVAGCFAATYHLNKMY